jgi:hypothetical protein
MRVSQVLATLALAAGLAAPSIAGATDPPNGPSTTAAQAPSGEQLFREGRALLVEGRFAEACAKLEQSQRVEPRGGTLLNVAACHERLGKLATAWQEFHDAATWARAEGHDDRAALAEQRIEAIEPRLAWITVTVARDPFAARASVAIDGAELPEKRFGERIPVDAGQHRVTARFADESTWEKVVAIEEAERQTVVVRPAAAVSEWAPPLPQYPRYPAPQVEAPLPQNDGRTQRALGLVTGAAGFASSGLGVYLLVHASRLSAQANTLCVNQECTVQGVDLVRSAQANNTAGIVVTSISAALVAGGGLIYLTAPSPKEGPTAGAVRVRAALGPQSVALQGSF